MKEIIKRSWIYKKMPQNIKNKLKKIYKKHNQKNVDDYYVATSSNEKRMKISFVIPQPIIGSGGHRNIYRIVNYLAHNGYDITCYVDPEGCCDPRHVKTGKEAYNKITTNFFDLGANIIFGTEKIEKCDVLFATHFASAYIVDNNKDKYILGCYFIQDYESYFFPMGDSYLNAHNTYKLGLYPITSGPWPLELLKNNFGITEGDYFRFPINTNVYYSDKTEKKNKVIFFAKPSMPRRCYNLGVSALKIVKEKCPELEIVFYGEKKESYDNVPFEFTNLGLLNTIEDLGNLYRKSLIGMAFSTTNPSLVPYEMMSCGCAVVDLNFNNSIVSYDSKNNVTLVDTTPEKIADGIVELYKNKDLREKQVKSALDFCKTFPTELEMCKLIEKYILKQYNKKVRSNKE